MLMVDNENPVSATGSVFTTYNNTMAGSKGGAWSLFNSNVTSTEDTWEANSRTPIGGSCITVSGTISSRQASRKLISAFSSVIG